MVEYDPLLTRFRRSLQAVRGVDLKALSQAPRSAVCIAALMRCVHGERRLPQLHSFDGSTTRAQHRPAPRARAGLGKRLADRQQFCAKHAFQLCAVAAAAQPAPQVPRHGAQAAAVPESLSYSSTESAPCVPGRSTLAASSRLATMDTDMRPTMKSCQNRCSFWSGRTSADRFANIIPWQLPCDWGPFRKLCLLTRWHADEGGMLHLNHSGCGGCSAGGLADRQDPAGERGAPAADGRGVRCRLAVCFYP